MSQSTLLPPCCLHMLTPTWHAFEQIQNTFLKNQRNKTGKLKELFCELVQYSVQIIIIKRSTYTAPQLREPLSTL